MSITDRPTVDFDHHSPEYGERSWEMYAEMRAKCPVAHTEAHGGYWVVSRYEDVAAIARDDATFSSRHIPGDPVYKGITIPGAPSVSVPIEMDPPEFLAYRRLLNPYFSPSATEKWLEIIRHWTQVCLDEVIETGEFDIVLDLANPVPALFTSEFLGLPLADWRKYAEPMHEGIYSVPGTPAHDHAQQGMGWVIQSLFQQVAERRVSPRDDVLSELTHATIDGQPISDELVVNMAFLIIAGGFDTTTAMMSNMMRWLAQHPDERQLLIDEPERIPLAIEEFLRYYTPTQALARTCMRDVEVAGVQMNEGDRVLISWASANHDPAVFDQPEEMILDRFPNRHTTFGLGVHRCLGSNFARAELALMLGEILRRIPDYEVIEERAERYTSIGVVNGWISMPARFTPGTRSGHEQLPG